MPLLPSSSSFQFLIETAWPSVLKKDNSRWLYDHHIRWSIEDFHWKKCINFTKRIGWSEAVSNIWKPYGSAVEIEFHEFNWMKRWFENITIQINPFYHLCWSLGFIDSTDDQSIKRSNAIKSIILNGSKFLSFIETCKC